MVYLYDFFKAPESLKDIIKEILIIPQTKPILDIIPEFQKANHSLGIIVDKDNRTLGLISSEDIFEEIFGEFEDEFDSNPIDTKLNKDGSISVNAKMKWLDFNKKYGDLIPKGEYETIAGYIISELGRIPNAGENLFMALGQVVIKKASDRYIEKVIIYPKIKSKI